VASLLARMFRSHRRVLNVLVQIAFDASPRTRWSTAVVPRAESWRESIVGPTTYAISPPYSELAGLLREAPGPAASEKKWQETLRRTVEAVAGLTAVDGAMV